MGGSKGGGGVRWSGSGAERNQRLVMVDTKASSVH